MNKLLTWVLILAMMCLSIHTLWTDFQTSTAHLTPEQKVIAFVFAIVGVFVFMFVHWLINMVDSLYNKIGE